MLLEISYIISRVTVNSLTLALVQLVWGRVSKVSPQAD